MHCKFKFVCCALYKKDLKVIAAPGAVLPVKFDSLFPIINFRADDHFQQHCIECQNMIGCQINKLSIWVTRTRTGKIVDIRPFYFLREDIIRSCFFTKFFNP